MFFCKFNDPVYVKLEKIDILVKVVDEKTADVILTELKEYSGEIDTEIVRRSVRAIGQIILKVDKSSKKAVEIISEIINQPGEIAI
jgi:AP-1 complex subunit beta-1